VGGDPICLLVRAVGMQLDTRLVDDRIDFDGVHVLCSDVQGEGNVTSGAGADDQYITWVFKPDQLKCAHRNRMESLQQIDTPDHLMGYRVGR
jgi:hypothetical protein